MVARFKMSGGKRRDFPVANNCSVSELAKLCIMAKIINSLFIANKFGKMDFNLKERSR
jgi:hypothetical protein